MKILIIEDEKLLADSIQTMLESRGFQVEAVYDGETGADYAELGIYDLLILDVMMPGMNGYQVARKVRSQRLGAPILMLTARSGLEDLEADRECSPTVQTISPDENTGTASVRASKRTRSVSGFHQRPDRFKSEEREVNKGC